MLSQGTKGLASLARRNDPSASMAKRTGDCDPAVTSRSTCDAFCADSRSTSMIPPRLWPTATIGGVALSRPRDEVANVVATSLVEQDIADGWQAHASDRFAAVEDVCGRAPLGEVPHLIFDPIAKDPLSDGRG